MALPPNKENAMMRRPFILRAVFAASAVTLALAGCSSMRGASGPKMDSYHAVMSGSQEVPAVQTPATGMADVWFNAATMELSWKVSYQGLSSAPTAGHIHGPAATGSNAGVLVPFASVANPTFEGKATITQAQATQLAGGLWYVNIHSQQHPAGEIRGQLLRK
jgi:hypothetical protein